MVGRRVWLCLLTVLFILFGAAEPSVAQDGRILELVRKVESTSGPGQQKVIEELLKSYDDYSHLVTQANSPINSKTARLIDNRRLSMVRETWEAIGRAGTGIDTIVPIGSAAKPFDPDYVVGKSDVDMIPYGDKADEAAEIFANTFRRKFGIDPVKLQVNVLSPTNISSWINRVGAIADVEKYNTLGGNLYLQQYLYDKNGQVWTLESKTGRMGTKTAQEFLGNKRPELSAEHAAGFYSDNSRFREMIAQGGHSDNVRALKQAKYDLRNVDAFTVAGGTLSDQEKLLVRSAELAKKNDVDRAVRLVLGLTENAPISPAQLSEYLAKFDALNLRMGQEIVRKHVELLRLNPSHRLTQELAGVLANLPDRQVEQIIRSVGSTVDGVPLTTILNEARTASKVLREQGGRARFISTYFDDAARKMFPEVANYAALSPQQKLILHQAGEEVMGWGEKAKRLVGGGLQGGFALWSAYDAYQRESSGSRGAFAAGARVMIELVQMGHPATAVAELFGRCAVFGVNLARDSWKDAHLDRLYAQYKSGSHDDVALNSVIHDFMFGKGASAYRQFGIDNRAKIEQAAGRELEGGALDGYVRAELEKYLVERLRAEKIAVELDKFTADAKVACRVRQIPLIPGDSRSSAIYNNERLERENPGAYLEAMLGLLEQYQMFEGWVESEGGYKLNRSQIWDLVNYWRQGNLELVAEYFFANTGKLAPAKIRQEIIDEFVRKHGGLGKFERAPDQGNIQSKTPLGKLGPVWKDAGAWVDFTSVEVGVKPNPNAARFRGSAGGWSAPIEVGPGKLKLVRQALPPYDQSWISGSNTAVTVKYQPKIGDQWGPEEDIPIDNGFMPVFENEATIPAPGVISVYVGLCYGAGNFLNWQQYAQTWNASLEIVERSEGWSPKVGTAIESGDRVRIDASSQPTIIRLPDGRYMLPEAGCEFSILNSDIGEITVTIHQGRARFRKPQDVKTKIGGDSTSHLFGPRTATKVRTPDGMVATPKGTDFVVACDDAGSSVTVLAGAVEVSDPAEGKVLDVSTGQRLNSADWEVVSAQEEIEQWLANHPLDNLLLDIHPEPYGTKRSYGVQASEEGDSDSGWHWLDQGQDAQFRLVGQGLHLEVPEGNACEYQEVSAPQLLHKVTGDFDLETTLHLPPGVTDSAIIIPLLHAPGSGVGYVQGQTEHFGSAANFYRFAPIHRVVPIWAEMGGRAVLPTFAVDPLSGFAAPDEPVWVRFHRRGDIWRTAWSLDGQRWNLSSRQRVSAPDTVWVGWAFSHTGNGVRPGEPAVFNLGPAKLHTAPFASLPIPDWDVVDQWGAPANIQLDQVSLAMGPATAGIVKAYSGTEWDFNFDVTLSTDRLEWPEVDGNYVVARVGLRVNDDNRTYVEIHQTGTAIRTETPFVVSQGTYGRGDAILPETLANQWRFQRTEGVVSISRQVEGQWVSMGEFSDVVNGPAFPFIELENAVEGAAPAQVRVRLHVTNNAKVDQRETDRPNANVGVQPQGELPGQSQPTTLDDEQLAAIFTASDPEFQTRYVGQKIRVRGTFQQREDASRRVVVDVGAGYRVSGAQIQNGTPNAFETVASFTPVWISGVILKRQSVPDSGGTEQTYLILESNGEFGVVDDSDVSKREPNDSAPRMNPAGQPKQPTTTNPELSGAYVDELRRQIAEMLTPDPNQAEPEGWSKSWHDPNRVLGLFKPLQLQEGYVLRAYLHREFNNGSGVVWAMPEDAEYPEPKDCPVLEHHFLQAPKPFDALGDTMEAIQGDDSQWSYFAASILRRELMEFGALWHGSEWGAHSVLDESPFQKQNQDPNVLQTPLSPRQEWKWSEAEPKDYRPKVVFEKDRVVVTYYTYTPRSGTGKNGETMGERITRFTDTYRRGKYRSSSTETVIGFGSRWVQF